MNCPYCKKLIYGMTGLQELQKFQKHLKSCRKNPDKIMAITKKGDLINAPRPSTLLNALNIRHESGQ